MKLVIIIAFGLTCVLTSRADDKNAITFLKIGKSYTLVSSDREHPDFGKGYTNVTIVEAGGGQWFRVRYRAPRGDLGSDRKWVELTHWLNFAHILGVYEAKEEERESQKK